MLWKADPTAANARPEWRGTESVQMQTERAITRPLQADG
jgi:hypothetical protein